MGVHGELTVHCVPRRVMSRQDSAIDRARSDLEAYEHDLDARHLTWSPADGPDGPAWFHLLPVEYAALGRAFEQTRHLGTDAGMAAALDELFRLGCVKLENVWARVERRARSGLVVTELVQVRLEQEVLAGSTRRMTDECARRIPAAVRVEMGSHVLRLSTLDAETRGNSSPPADGTSSAATGTTASGAT